jgi:predicted dehydrogenase/cyclophilin family peptidyl-prolyl cis-trans isomerase
VATVHGCGPIQDGRELAGQKDVEAVLLFASGCHRDAVLDLLAARKPLFVEKPLAFSLPETEEVARAVREAGVPFMMGYHKRFDPAYLRARRAVQEMRDLRYVEVTILHPDDGAYRTHHVVLPRPDGPWQSRPEPEQVADTHERVMRGALKGCVDRIVGDKAPVHHRVGAALLFESVIHDIDAVRGVLGDPEGVVSAHVWRDGLAQTSISRFPGDVRFVSWISARLKHYEERLRSWGPTRGHARLPSPISATPPRRSRLSEWTGGAGRPESHRVLRRKFRAELHHFHEALNRAAPEPSLEDALGDARWIHQIAAAYADGPRDEARVAVALLLGLAAEAALSVQAAPPPARKRVLATPPRRPRARWRRWSRPRKARSRSACSRTWRRATWPTSRRRRAGGFDGTTFHRIVPRGTSRVVIRSKDPPRRRSTEREGWACSAEFSPRPMARGSVAAVLQPNRPDSGGNQFFVVLSDQPSLTGKFTIFGEVTSGMDVVDRIGETPVEGDKPVKRIVLQKVTIRAVAASPSPSPSPAG